MSLLGPSIAMAAPPPSGGELAPSVSLTCDTTKLGPEVGPRLEQELLEQIGLVLQRQDLHVVSDAEIATHTVRVSIIGFDEGQRDYEVELQMTSELATVSISPVRCEACNERQLITKVVESTPQLVELHDKRAEPVAPVPPPIVAPPAVPTEAPKARMKALGFSGIGMIGLGAAALASGAYLLSRGEERVGFQLGEMKEIHNFQRPGAGVLAAGVVITSLGATLLALDRRNARKARQPRFALGLSPTYVGFQIQQRF